MVAKKKILILGCITIILIIAVGIGLILYNKKEVDYVFEGTFVKTEDSMICEKEVQDIDKSTDNNESADKEDCFKRNSRDCFFV